MELENVILIFYFIIFRSNIKENSVILDNVLYLDIE